MQNPKVLSLICVIALGATLCLRAQDADNPAQAAARAAVASKLFELSSEESTNSSAAVTTPPTAQTPADQSVMTKPADATMVPITGDNGAPPTADQKAQAAALVAAQEKAQKEAAKQAAAQKRADEAAAKAKAKADKKAAALKAKQDAAAAAAAAAQAKEQAKEQATATAQANVSASQPAAAATITAPTAQQTAAMTAMASQTNQPVATPMPASTMPFYTPPPPPVSAEKLQQLNDLLTKYQADQITPEQYHTQRAAILAQP